MFWRKFSIWTPWIKTSSRFYCPEFSWDKHVVQTFCQQQKWRLFNFVSVCLKKKFFIFQTLIDISMLSPHRTNEFCPFNVSFDFGFIYYHYRSLCLCICLCVVFAKRPMPFFNSSLCSISNPFSAETECTIPLPLPLVVSQFCSNILDKSRFPPYFLVSYHFRSHFLN